MVDHEYLTTQQVADLVGVSYQTVRRWIRRGDLPAYKIGGQVRIDKDDLDRYIKSHRIQPQDMGDQ